jgi:hypothetical protein
LGAYCSNGGKALYPNLIFNAFPWSFQGDFLYTVWYIIQLTHSFYQNMISQGQVFLIPFNLGKNCNTSVLGMDPQFPSVPTVCDAWEP